ncbi:MAG TPA: DUF6504 family protein [Symbiobacteriaceae bacterium]|nr:DUF6504 family protein [Symbiobacteriaceae bacterium]
MTRILNRPADVTMGPGGRPVAFRWTGGRYRVREVLDSWLEAGRWWEQEGERQTYRVATVEGGVFELTLDPAVKKWSLYKAYD